MRDMGADAPTFAIYRSKAHVTMIQGAPALLARDVLKLFCSLCRAESQAATTCNIHIFEPPPPPPPPPHPAAVHTFPSSICVGDHFLLGPSTLGDVDCIWDRAALVAVRPPERSAYVAVLKKALKPRGRILLTTLDRAAGPDSARELGPPFSVTGTDVQKLFGGWCEISKLESVELIHREDHERFRQQGLTSLLEECYLLTKR